MTMGIDELICPMCGVGFDPALYSSCSSCPMQNGCILVCCPVCGYQTVAPERSAAARFAARFFTALKKPPNSAETSNLDGSVM